MEPQTPSTTMRQQVHIPANFIPEQIIEGYNPRWHDKYLWVVHSIVFLGYQNKETFGGRVQLNIKLLEKFIGANYYKTVIDQLVQSGVIEIWSNYQQNVFSKSYRLRDEFRSTKVELRYTIKSTYHHKLIKHNEQHLKDTLRRSPNLLHEFNNLTKLRIDVDRATAYVNENYEEGTDRHNTRILAIYYLNELHKADFRQGHYKIGFFFKYKGGRLYTPFTSCPKDLEKFLSFGESSTLIEADAKNSQLVFADKLLISIGQDADNQRFISNLKNIRDGIKKGYRKWETPQISAGSNPLTTHPSTSLSYVLYSELNHLISKGWSSVVSAGKGYEAMMMLSNYNGKSFGHSRRERAEFKDVFFGQLFYNKFNVDRPTRMEKVFYEYFPEEALALFTARYTYGNSGFAVKVQEMEGRFFHDTIVGKMRTGFVTVPMVIKHDSITIPMERADEIIPILDELLKEHLNDYTLTFRTSTYES